MCAGHVHDVIVVIVANEKCHADVFVYNGIRVISHQRVFNFYNKKQSFDCFIYEDR